MIVIRQTNSYLPQSLVSHCSLHSAAAAADDDDDAAAAADDDDEDVGDDDDDDAGDDAAAAAAAADDDDDDDVPVDKHKFCVIIGVGGCKYRTDVIEDLFDNPVFNTECDM